MAMAAHVDALAGRSFFSSIFNLSFFIYIAEIHITYEKISKSRFFGTITAHCTIGTFSQTTQGGEEREPGLGAMLAHCGLKAAPG